MKCLNHEVSKIGGGNLEFAGGNPSIGLEFAGSNPSIDLEFAGSNPSIGLRGVILQ